MNPYYLSIAVVAVSIVALGLVCLVLVLMHRLGGYTHFRQCHWTGTVLARLDDKTLVSFNGEAWVIPEGRKVIGLHLPGAKSGYLPSMVVWGFGQNPDKSHYAIRTFYRILGDHQGNVDVEFDQPIDPCLVGIPSQPGTEIRFFCTYGIPTTGGSIISASVCKGMCVA